MTKIQYLLGLLVAFATADAQEMYYDCVKYGPSLFPIQTPYPGYNMDNFCMSERSGPFLFWYLYCRYWYCPRPHCTDHQTNPGNNCPFCEGTCSYGGYIYYERESFLSVDNVNTCWCERDGYVSCTEIGYTKEDLCNAPQN